MKRQILTIVFVFSSYYICLSQIEYMIGMNKPVSFKNSSLQQFVGGTKSQNRFVKSTFFGRATEIYQTKKQTVVINNEYDWGSFFSAGNELPNTKKAEELDEFDLQIQGKISYSVRKK